MPLKKMKSARIAAKRIYRLAKLVRKSNRKARRQSCSEKRDELETRLREFQGEEIQAAIRISANGLPGIGRTTDERTIIATEVRRMFA